jgi:hypothetical protein
MMGLGRLRKNHFGISKLRWPAGLRQDGNTTAGCSKRLSNKAATSEEARRYAPHFVWPFTPRIDLGERISASSTSDIHEIQLYTLSL